MMEIRVLEYFLAVAREQNISKAAEYLHLTQPTLSRQLKALEEEFGKQLFVRGKRKVLLTEDGARFRKMAEEIVSLANRAETMMKSHSDTLAGDIYIGAGESKAMHEIIAVAGKIQRAFPEVHFHITSGDTDDLTERLDKGLFDFCVLYGEIDQAKYEYLALPYAETWGVLMRRDSSLAKQETVSTTDLWEQPLILSRQSMSSPRFFKWIGKTPEELHIANTYNLVYNGQFMAEEGMGYVLTLQDLVNTEGTELCFRPIVPNRTLPLSLVWKKYRTQSKVAEKFIEALTAQVETVVLMSRKDK